MIAAIVTAAGTGERMGTAKQFLELAGRERMVDRAVATCRRAADWVGLVLPVGADWDGPAVDVVIAGGADRWASITNAVRALPRDTDIVVIHSASHPLASPALLDRVVAAVRDGADGAVPIQPTADVIKRVDDAGTVHTVGREGLGTSQVPTAWRRASLDRAVAEVTDAVEEGAAVEATGGRIVAVRGELANLHLVDSESLRVIRQLAAPPPAGD